MNKNCRTLIELCAIFLLAVVNLGQTQASAAGAIAEGIAPGGPQQSYSFGIGYNQQDENAAKEQAVNTCKKFGDATSQQRCHAVITFNNQCAASAEDPKGGTPGVGWAIGATQQAADAEALSRCKSTAGAESYRRILVTEGVRRQRFELAI